MINTHRAITPSCHGFAHFQYYFGKRANLFSSFFVSVTQPSIRLSTPFTYLNRTLHHITSENPVQTLLEAHNVVSVIFILSKISHEVFMPTCQNHAPAHTTVYKPRKSSCISKWTLYRLHMRKRYTKAHRSSD